MFTFIIKTISLILLCVWTYSFLHLASMPKIDEMSQCVHAPDSHVLCTFGLASQIVIGKQLYIHVFFLSLITLFVFVTYSKNKFQYTQKSNKRKSISFNILQALFSAGILNSKAP